jgi:hypothetical protein
VAGGSGQCTRADIMFHTTLGLFIIRRQTQLANHPPHGDRIGKSIGVILHALRGAATATVRRTEASGLPLSGIRQHALVAPEGHLATTTPMGSGPPEGRAASPGVTAFSVSQRPLGPTATVKLREGRSSSSVTSRIHLPQRAAFSFPLLLSREVRSHMRFSATAGNDHLINAPSSLRAPAIHLRTPRGARKNGPKGKATPVAHMPGVVLRALELVVRPIEKTHCTSVVSHDAKVRRGSDAGEV